MLKRLLIACGVFVMFAGYAFAEGNVTIDSSPAVVDCSRSPSIDICQNDLVLRFAQTQPSAPPGSQMLVPAPGPAIGGGQIGAPTYVIPPTASPPASSGAFDIGQVLGPILQPYIDAAVAALLTSIVSWIGYLAQKWFGIKLDEGARKAAYDALDNQANSLIADGMVKFEGGKFTIQAGPWAESVNEVLGVVPDAAKRLGFTPSWVKDRIVDRLPQTPAGAAMVASATPIPVVTVPAATKPV